MLTIEEKYVEDVKRIQAYAEKGIKFVEVYTHIDSNIRPCSICLENAGVIYTIDEALGLSPVPQKDCTNTNGCRCLYFPAILEPEVIKEKRYE